MPDTFIGLAVLLLLLMPGAIFAIQADSRAPSREVSAFRELVTIAGVGTICDVIVLLIFAVIRIAAPGVTPNLASLALIGTSYARLHTAQLAWWIFGLFVAACALAFLLGRFWPGIAGRLVSGKIRFTSAWWELFHAMPDCQNYVTCELTDGSYIAGPLFRYSSESDETNDREIGLVATPEYPIMYQPVGDQTIKPYENVNTLSISARRIKYMAVTYLEVTNDWQPPKKFTGTISWGRFHVEFTRFAKQP